MHGVYYIYEDIDASVFEDLCTAKEYVLTNKQVYSPKLIKATLKWPLSAYIKFQY